MVRVWLRPCASAIAALGRRSNAQAAVLRVQIPSTLSVNSHVLGVRSLSSKGKDEGKKKKSTFDKVEADEDPTELPDEVKYLSQQLDDKELKFAEVDLDDDNDNNDDDDDDDDDDDEISPAEWAKKFEREVAEWDQEDEGEDYVDMGEVPSEVEDDRLYVEMPGYDALLSLAESQIGVNEDESVADPFQHVNQGMAMSPEMLNWMLPADKRKPMKKDKTKPWKYFVAANHQDVVELALDVDLLRLFISPTGRIRPRRFTGLTAKQQRKLAQAVKVSRQLALLPYLSRYPEPTPAQWKAIDDEIIAAAELEEDNDVVDDDDDEDFDEDFEYD
ncbi:hypothetical protein PRIC2_010772 [Phytophthora ramorum]